MTALSPHFTLAEMTVTDTGLLNIPSQAQVDRLIHTAENMEIVREKALGGLPVVVSSAFRCPAVNARVGGAPTSDHLKGDAVDFTCPRFGTPLEIAQAIVKAQIPFDQLILEPSWVHISFGPRMRNERLTKRRGSNFYERGINP